MSEFASLISHREVPAGSPVPTVTSDDAPRARVLRLRRRGDDGTLASLKVGSSAIVRGVGGDLQPAAVRRLVDLGFAPGAVVEVLRRAPLADPTVFRVADTEIALRRRHAAAICVDVTSHR